MEAVNLIPLPTATITDDDIAAVLLRAAQVIDPLLDVLAEADPLGLRERTHHLGGPAGSALGRVEDAFAWALNTAKVPGTLAWEDMPMDDRIEWWIHRVGALNTVIVAFPGVLGAVADRLPIQDLFGYANQAIVLCAVAREHGIFDHRQQVRLLAAVLSGRDLVPDGSTEALPSDSSALPRTPAGVAQGLWRLAGLMRAITDELAKRPHPKGFYRVVGMLPGVGAVADYIGEYCALVRAAKAGERWIAQQSVL
ncbi:MAG: hypothetical protein QOK12_3240 [Mycobacterium sp.]|jgi:hypothetical protein|nr:hypothetical protein [Mycobacterium sp.]